MPTSLVEALLKPEEMPLMDAYICTYVALCFRFMVSRELFVVQLSKCFYYSPPL